MNMKSAAFGGRKGGKLLLGSVAVLLVLGAVWAGAQRPAAAPLPFIPLATDKSLGINADLARLSPAEREAALAEMEAAGFRWLRQRFPWDAIEPQQRAFDWAVWDEIVAGAARHNLILIAVLDGSPPWARAAFRHFSQAADGDRDNPLAPPTETHYFGDFVAAFAARYGDRIDYYQIWDEPNIAPHWGAGEIDPAAYGRLLREGAIRLRAADPGAVVLLAALAPNVEPGGANMSELLFLDTLYRRGAAEWFDVVAVQPYDFGQPLDAAPDPAQLNWQRATLLRQVMEAHGDAETAVWAVSFGTEQPGLAAEAVERARQAWPWLGPMLWAAWSPDDAHGEYALGDADRRALGAEAAASPRAWPGVYPADHPGGHYEGGWRVTPAGADIGASGDRLTIPFWGTGLDLTVRRGDYRAFLFVSVDGAPANALPRDTEGRAYVVLYDPEAAAPQTVTLARNLPPGEHVAEIVAARGWGQWAIVGWSVHGEAAAAPPPWLSPLLVPAALVVLTAVLSLSWPYRRLPLAAAHSLLARSRALDDRIALLLTAGAALLVYIMVGTIPTLLALALLALLLFLRPEMGLPLIALALPFYQLGRPLFGKVFSMVEILTLLTAFGLLGNWVVDRLGVGSPNFPTSQFPNSQSTNLPTSQLTDLDWGVVALVVVGAASLLWAEHVRVAAREFRTVILESAVFYGLLRLTIRERRAAWRMADAWLLGAGLIALIGVGQWLLGRDLITAEGVARVRGFYGSPNNLALYLGRAFPLAVAVAAWGGAGNRQAAKGAKEGGAEPEGRSVGDAPGVASAAAGPTPSAESPGVGRRWLYGLAALVMAFALLLTHSRGAWLVGVPASLLFLAAMRSRRTFAVAVVVLLIAALGVVGIIGPGRLVSLLDFSEGTTFFRLQLWRSSLAMLADHPLLGVGPDNFLYAYRSRYVLPTAWKEFNLSHPHNFVLDFWLRLGLPGLLVIFWLLVGFFRQGRQLYRRGGALSLPALGLMGGMVNFVAHGLVDNAFFLVDLAFVFMLMLALVQCECPRIQRSGGSSRRA